MLNSIHGNITTHYLLPLKPLQPKTKSTYSFTFSCNCSKQVLPTLDNPSFSASTVSMVTTLFNSTKHAEYIATWPFSQEITQSMRKSLFVKVQNISPRIAQQTGRISSLIMHMYMYRNTQTHTHTEHSSCRCAAVGVCDLLFCRLSGLPAVHPCCGCQRKACHWHPSACRPSHSADWPLTEESLEGAAPAAEHHSGPPSSSAEPRKGRWWRIRWKKGWIRQLVIHRQPSLPNTHWSERTSLTAGFCSRADERNR